MSYKIKDAIESNRAKAEFWRNNKDLFLQYNKSLFTAETLYDMLISAGNFKQLEANRKENSKFDFEVWKRYLADDKLAEFKI